MRRRNVDVVDYLEKCKNRGVSFIGHGGAAAGFRTVALRFPSLRLGIVALANLATFTPEAVALKVTEAHLGDSVEWEPAAPPAVLQKPAEPIAVSTEELQVSRRRLEGIRHLRFGRAPGRALPAAHVAPGRGSDRISPCPLADR